ncbi:MerR family transcriptional regulator [Streptomyces sp. MST-110588]|uniref:MerR family transcriptional regulator n=1 Tax=Streptomyces sp. MST-110588 TaxID=2833628 RepID=UPI001F5CEB4E|nr:MerR family transcriptional regulator [Streptomyces sp. MST-110588]UNO41914.1 MerR family transcriptional regulator [Streptomyces sp. MST-110588]
MNGDSDTLHSIGDLARRTGLTVKTVRFYSDAGIVPPTDRSPAGYRLYGADAVARLDLVRTLRDLGLDLATIRKVVDREVSLPEVAAAHAEALEVQIRVLRLRRAVLTAVARRGSSPKELDLMHRLARLSAAERQSLIDDFLGTVFDGLHDHPAFAAVTRSMTPELPENPEPEQIEAWVNLAELFQDRDFRTTMRGMARDLATDRAPDDATGLPRILAEAVRAQVTPALEAGTDPASPEAEPVVAALTAHYAYILGQPAGSDGPADPAGPAEPAGHDGLDDAELRRRLMARLESMDDPRRDQYLHLLAVVNGWPAPESLAPVLAWSVAALRARMSR